MIKFITRRSFLLIGLFWFANSVAQTSNPQKYKYIFTVAKDGSGDFTFIQDAINAMRVYPLSPIRLFIKNGVYTEKIELPADNTDVHFIGESADKTIISFNDYSGRGKINTFNSYTAKISGNRFVAENITFSNTAGPVGQALALYVDADKAVFKNCRFLGNQDTIFASGENARQLFDHCYIEGTTDFIFGAATTVFQDCIIRCKANSYITAANTTAGKSFGFVFLHCRVEVDSAVSKVFLGRPWRAFAKTVFINSYLPEKIASAGWHNWDNPENEKTVFYGEYNNEGPGALTSGRAAWSIQLSAKQVKLYTLENIFARCVDVAPVDANWYKNLSMQPFTWPLKTNLHP
ncbi:MAG: pectinesterase [Ferruginibacter sp.]|nr:pectinesterase [Ferruginibacter sp.]